MKIKCNVCGGILKEQGALLFTPPDKKGMVKKYHICKICSKILIKRCKVRHNG